MTPSRPDPQHEQNDPRLLLPEWLRDPGEPSKPEPSSNGSARSGARVAQTLHDDVQHFPEPDGATSWQQPPATQSGTFDPSILIAFDDLPDWMQRLHARTDRTSPDATTAQRAEPVDSPDDAGTQEEQRLTEDHIDEPELQASDLSLSGFAWIAGTAIALIIAAIIVLFG